MENSKTNSPMILTHCKRGMKFLSPLSILLLCPLLGWAESGGHGESHGDGGIPKVVFWQLLNFAIFVGLLFFLLRKNVISHFQKRREDFLSAVTKAQKIRHEAEERHSEIQTRLNRLKQEEGQNRQRAHEEAESYKRHLLQEATNIAKGVEEESSRMVQVEKAKALAKVREELIQESMKQAREKLSKSLENQDQDRLQSEFIEKIQVVRP